MFKNYYKNCYYLKNNKSKIFKIINMIIWCNGEHNGL